MSYNAEHVPSIDYVNNAVINAYEKMKTWLTNNVDQLDYVQRILEKEIEALRVASGTYTSAYEAAEALNTAVENIVSTLENEGYDLTGITTADLYTIISNAINSQAVFILDVNEDEWTTDEWEEYKAAHSGAYPATPAAVGVRTSEGTKYFSLDYLGGYKWGTYGVSVGNINGYSGGFAGTPTSGLFNTRRLLSQFDPAVLIGSRYAIEDGASATYDEATIADVLFFDTLADLEAWGNSIGATPLALLGTAKMYAVVLDADAGTYTLYYYSGGGSSVAFTSVRTVPYTDSQNTVGTPAAKFAFVHASTIAFATDSEWVSYLPSVFELGVFFLNKTAISAALSACGGSYSSSIYWSCLQNNHTNAYYVELGAGTINGNNKNNAYGVRACLVKL